LIFQAPFLDFEEGVQTGVKGKTFYQLRKHSISCLLLRVEVPPNTIHLIVEEWLSSKPVPCSHRAKPWKKRQLISFDFYFSGWKL